MKNIPNKIYLQVDPEKENPEFFSELDTTWCSDRINDNDIPYYRKQVSVEPVVILQGELLPCPFCGEVPEYNKQNSLIQQKQMWQIYCDSGRCEIKPKTDLYKYKKECLADWNKRAGREPKSK